MRNGKIDGEIDDRPEAPECSQVLFGGPFCRDNSVFSFCVWIMLIMMMTFDLGSMCVSLGKAYVIEIGNVISNMGFFIWDTKTEWNFLFFYWKLFGIVRPRVWFLE